MLLSETMLLWSSPDLLVVFDCCLRLDGGGEIEPFAVLALFKPLAVIELIFLKTRIHLSACPTKRQERTRLLGFKSSEGRRWKNAKSPKSRAVM